jgi:hypothetical protein
MNELPKAAVATAVSRAFGSLEVRSPGSTIFFNKFTNVLASHSF